MKYSCEYHYNYDGEEVMEFFDFETLDDFLRWYSDQQQWWFENTGDGDLYFYACKKAFPRKHITTDLYVSRNV